MEHFIHELEPVEELEAVEEFLSLELADEEKQHYYQLIQEI